MPLQIGQMNRGVGLMNSYIFRISLLIGLALSSSVFAISFEPNSCNSALAGVQKPSVLRSLSEIEKLKIVTYNLKDFKVSDSSRVPQGMKDNVPIKAPELIKKQRDLLKGWDADIYMLEEVFDKESLKVLVPPGYASIFVEGNDWGRHIAFLVKKDLPLHVSLETHRSETWNNGNETKKLFSRDLPLLFLRTDPSKPPTHILIGNHGKSMRGDRATTAELRTAQYERAREIIEDYEKKYPQAAIIFAGDFNVDMRRSAKEIEPIEESMVNTFDLKKVPSEDRITHVSFYKGKTSQSQLDNFYVSENMAHQVVSVKVLPYLDEDGNPKDLPENYKERDENGSDHEAVELVISTDDQFNPLKVGLRKVQ